MERPNWDEYFMNIAHVVKSRSNCMTRQTGAIIVKDKRIIGTGYNGTPMGIKNCFEGGCPRCTARMNGTVVPGNDLDKCVCCHAEENAIVHSALHGNATKGSMMYITFTPCTQCAKMIINAGITKVVSAEKYPNNDLSIDLLRDAGVELVVFNHS